MTDLSLAPVDAAAIDRSPDADHLVTWRFLAGRGRTKMSVDEERDLEAAMTERQSIEGRRILVRQGQHLDTSTYLISGYICRYMDDRQGHRQLVAIHVPGDFVDLHAFPLKRLDHDVATLGPVEIGLFRHATLQTVMEDRPHLARMLWYSTLLDASMHREWIFRLGRLGAAGRIAHFFCELDTRLAMVGLSDGSAFSLPLTQADLAEATGLTGVHANRTLRRLREDGVMSFRNGDVEIFDRTRLARIAEFEPDYLYGDPVSAQEG